MVSRWFLPFAAGFRAGLALRRAAYRYGLAKTRRLNRPVVSVGNLTVGGTGKTPLVMYIAERLLEHGWTPSILTRGYRRGIGEMVAISPQSRRQANPREVGDEPALMAAALPRVPIVVGANRYRAGRLAEERFTVDVHLLDDGFQHWSLARNVDVVTVDVSEDRSRSALLPAGPFREPFSALGRAHVVVLTRTELADPAGYREIVANCNPQAGIFESSLSLRGLVDAQSGSPVPPERIHGRPALAFCGIGNPRAFFQDLRKWGMEVAREVAYRDHHRYGPGELHRLARRAEQAGVEILLTTEKDVANFPANWKTSLPVLACVARLEIQSSDAFLESLIRRLHSLKIAG
jgi:tetraacyldisaccharide 4'-kinase